MNPLLAQGLMMGQGGGTGKLPSALSLKTGGMAAMAGMPGMGAMGLGMGGMPGMGGGGSKVGEVRFDNPQSALVAIQALNESVLMGETIQVVADTSSADATKVLVSGLAGGVGWQDLKDHFKQVGKVSFAAIK